MTKRHLKDCIAKLEKVVKAHEQQADELRKQLAELNGLADRCKRAAKQNEKLVRVLEKVWQKRRRDKARIEQMYYQLDAMAESQLMLRSELYANINAAQLRSAKAGVQVSDIERVMPNGGRPALVHEDDERSRGKRFGTMRG